MKFSFIIVLFFLISCKKNMDIINEKQYTVYSNDGFFIKKTFKNGLLHGEKLFFYYNNELIRENYNNGKLDGQRIICYKNGNINVIENYNNGKEEGKWIYFTKDGKRQKIETYKNGELVK